MLVVLTTTPNLEEAHRLARLIVEARLAACVQVLPEMKSFYYWEDAIQQEAEHLLLIKTREEKFDELKEFIHANHSYSVPEIVALGAERVAESYLQWMLDYLRQPAQKS